MHTATQQTDNSAHRGVFVTFEGVDGAGKSTQCALVCAGLAMLGRTVERLREPGGCAIGERVRAVLLDPERSGMVTPSASCSSTRRPAPSSSRRSYAPRCRRARSR